MASARELTRSGFTVAVILASFVLMLGIFIALDFLFGERAGEQLKRSLGVVSAMGMMAIAFTGTAVPLVTYRDRGTLRILSATPVSRLAFLVGQVPVRAAIAAIELIVILATMLVVGARHPGDYLTVVLSTLCGFLMFMSLGVLLGARGTNSELIMQISLILPVVVIFTSGVAIPIDFFPQWMQFATELLPTTWFMASLNDWVTTDDFLVQHWLGMTGLSAASLACAARYFVWDGSEPKRVRRT